MVSIRAPRLLSKLIVTIYWLAVSPKCDASKVFVANGAAEMEIVIPIESLCEALDNISHSKKVLTDLLSDTINASTYFQPSSTLTSFINLIHLMKTKRALHTTKIAAILKRASDLGYKESKSVDFVKIDYKGIARKKRDLGLLGVATSIAKFASSAICLLYTSPSPRD